ncbi:hypothetical protein WMF31_33915 [Sorangium sp. So ce1036]|uniref:hypothetical protein n=1 Tax=Sorangium sp. So ce1036 TaxID=3133328 RepID=UPI003F006D9F
MNRAGWPALPLPRRIALPDPRDLLASERIAAPDAFAARSSLFVLRGTTRSTRPGRHRQGDALLARALRGSSPVVLDVGAADGSTSLDLLAALGDRFAAYYVTDRTLSLRARTDDRGRAFLYDAEDGTCVLIATPRWVVYPAAEVRAGWLRRALPWLRGGIPPFDPAYPEVSLVQPRLREVARRDARVIVRAYNVLEPWDGPAPTVVKIANLLNRAFLPDAAIRRATRNLYRALPRGGLLLVIDNRVVDGRPVEKASLLERGEGGFRHVESVNGGTEILDLALRRGD